MHFTATRRSKILSDPPRRETLDDVIPPPGNLGKGVPCLEVHEASIGKKRAAETRGRVIPEEPTSQSIVEFQGTPIRRQNVGKNKGRVGRAPRARFWCKKGEVEIGGDGEMNQNPFALYLSIPSCPLYPPSY